MPMWNNLAEVMDGKVHVFDMLRRKNSTRCDSELGCEDVGRIQSRRPCMGYRSELGEDCVLHLDQERK